MKTEFGDILAGSCGIPVKKNIEDAPVRPRKRDNVHFVKMLSNARKQIKAMRKLGAGDSEIAKALGIDEDSPMLQQP